eukprot:CAMPEP_0114497408 /NCGR_PEP_ID=MMETSP0109-20121206/6311_1 /TAXON_ID=29199 /ORGANISM="Chlorarachnion reptans, Strain CCCM449" /LENGTH=122 /DNA_ID=CAMNT_0001674793 /DNA_START=94 /DNA_END=462 /DNA_ORIENTATION=-
MTGSKFQVSPVLLPGETEPRPEVRIDEKTGDLLSEKQFVERYRGTDQWDVARAVTEQAEFEANRKGKGSRRKKGKPKSTHGKSKLGAPVIIRCTGIGHLRKLQSEVTSSQASSAGLSKKVKL